MVLRDRRVPRGRAKRRRIRLISTKRGAARGPSGPGAQRRERETGFLHRITFHLSARAPSRVNAHSCCSCATSGRGRAPAPSLEQNRQAVATEIPASI